MSATTTVLADDPHAMCLRLAASPETPHCLLVAAAVKRAEARGEKHARARLARHLLIDRAVITGMMSGTRKSFGGPDGDTRVEWLLEHLRDPAAHPLPEALISPGRTRIEDGTVRAKFDMTNARRLGAYEPPSVTPPVTVTYDRAHGGYRLIGASGKALAEGPRRKVEPVLARMYRMDEKEMKDVDDVTGAE